MEKLAIGLLLVPFALVLSILLSTVICGTFLYFGWNGCHELLGMREIFFSEACWLAMLARSIFTVSSIKAGD